MQLGEPGFVREYPLLPLLFLFFFSSVLLCAAFFVPFLVRFHTVRLACPVFESFWGMFPPLFACATAPEATGYRCISSLAAFCTYSALQACCPFFPPRCHDISPLSSAFLVSSNRCFSSSVVAISCASRSSLISFVLYILPYSSIISSAGDCRSVVYSMSSAFFF